MNNSKGHAAEKHPRIPVVQEYLNTLSALEKVYTKLKYFRQLNSLENTVMTLIII
jgi:hypothetical protein